MEKNVLCWAADFKTFFISVVHMLFTEAYENDLKRIGVSVKEYNQFEHKWELVIQVFCRKAEFQAFWTKKNWLYEHIQREKKLKTIIFLVQTYVVTQSIHSSLSGARSFTSDKHHWFDLIFPVYWK